MHEFGKSFYSNVDTLIQVNYFTSVSDKLRAVAVNKFYSLFIKLIRNRDFP